LTKPNGIGKVRGPQAWFFPPNSRVRRKIRRSPTLRLDSRILHDRSRAQIITGVPSKFRAFRPFPSSRLARCSRSTKRVEFTLAICLLLSSVTLHSVVGPEQTNLDIYAKTGSSECGKNQSTAGSKAWIGFRIPNQHRKGVRIVFSRGASLVRSGAGQTSGGGRVAIVRWARVRISFESAPLRF
jgi:hypothetical protein